MPVQLIVAEKPSVARDLARVLQASQRREAMYCNTHLWITWCIGHMAQLCEPDAYDPAWKVWRADTLPMIPDRFCLRPIDSSAQHWQRLSKLLCDRQVHTVINACDAGREGELIFRFAMELAGSRKPVQRLWLNALTDTAVRRAMASLQPAAQFDPLAAAARCRAEADWLIGLNATRAMTLRHRPTQGKGVLLTVGRVQTPTLGMIVRREDAIEVFVPDNYWQVLAQFSNPQGLYWGTYMAPKPRAGTHGDPVSHAPQPTAEPWPDDRLRDKSRAEAVLAAIAQAAGTVRRADHNEQKEQPPLLYDLTALQRRANVRYGMTARATLDAAQGLYERHKAITYPRTDSNYLPKDLAASLPGVLKRLAQSDYHEAVAPLLANLPLPLSRRIIDDAAVTDHHAIVPTGRVLDRRNLSQDEAHIMDLVVRRFIAVFYPPARFAQVRIDTEVATHLFCSCGRTLLEAGWQAVDPPAAAPRGKNAAPAPELLPAVRAGDPIQVAQAKLHQGQTKAPPRFSEAMLLSAMERAGRQLEDAALKGAIKDAGIGTPATRAAIIETLKKRDFIRVEGKSLVPTAQGRRLIGAMPVEALKSAQLTGEWEARLSQMARGEFSREVFMGQVHSFARQVVADILGYAVQEGSPPTPDAVACGSSSSPTSVAPGGRPLTARTAPVTAADASLNVLCPVCQSPVMRRGKVYTCEQSRTCTFVIFTQIAQRPIEAETVTTLIKAGRTPRLTGFINRDGKPFTAALVLSPQGRVTFSF